MFLNNNDSSSEDTSDQEFQQDHNVSEDDEQEITFSANLMNSIKSEKSNHKLFKVSQTHEIFNCIEEMNKNSQHNDEDNIQGFSDFQQLFVKNQDFQARAIQIQSISNESTMKTQLLEIQKEMLKIQSQHLLIQTFKQNEQFNFKTNKEHAYDQQVNKLNQILLNNRLENAQSQYNSQKIDESQASLYNTSTRERDESTLTNDIIWKQELYEKNSSNQFLSACTLISFEKSLNKSFVDQLNSETVRQEIEFHNQFDDILLDDQNTDRLEWRKDKEQKEFFKEDLLDQTIDTPTLYTRSYQRQHSYINFKEDRVIMMSPAPQGGIIKIGLSENIHSQLIVPQIDIQLSNK